MNLHFIYTGNLKNSPQGKAFVHSVRRSMPGLGIVQISDQEGWRVDGVDRFVEYGFYYSVRDWPLTFFNIMIDVGVDFYVDTDVIFNGDMRDVLEAPGYEVAICKRHKNDGTGSLYRRFHPYNGGLMVVRNPDFWRACRENMLEKFNMDGSEVGQQVIAFTVNTGGFKVRFLDGAIYNRTPQSEDEFDPSVVMWHFKGKRKEMMQRWLIKHSDKLG